MRTANSACPTDLQPTTDLERLGEEIATLAAQLSVATYHLLILIREFDDRSGWNGGFRSCAHWLSWRTGLAIGPAREKVRVAHALKSLPQIADAMQRGELSYSKVRALTRVATPANERSLLNVAMAGSAQQVERVVRGLRRADGQDAHHDTMRHARRYLDLFEEEDGTVVLRGRLDPETGAVLRKALDAARDVLYDEARERALAGGAEAVTPGQQLADAVGRMAEAALAGGLDQGTRGDRYQVVVHVDATTLAGEQEDGASVLEGRYVPAGTSQRVSCDASRVVMTHAQDADETVLDVGRKTRVVSPALRRALTQRDQTCRFPGCSITYCEAHHLTHWAEGGPTSMDNLALLCRRHHRCLHEEGYRGERAADGALRFFRPNGQLMPEAPPSPVTGAEVFAQFTQRLAATGTPIVPLPAPPDEGRLDLEWTIGVLT